jgi:chemotaxis protein MotA
MNVASLFGGFFAGLAVLGGILAAGGDFSLLFSPTAVLSVWVGTLGAVLLSGSMSDVLAALRAVPAAFGAPARSEDATIEEIVQMSALARKEGLLAIEGARSQIRNPLFRQAIKYVIDGFESPAVREIVDGRIRALHEQELRPAQVLEGAAQVSPALGALGAVLTLIPALPLAATPGRLGPAAAAALVCVLHGLVASALVYRPLARKLRDQAERRTREREIVRLGVTGILEGLNPQFMKERLESQKVSGS